MKTTRLLRVLSLLGVLLLFAPFYDSCDGKYLHKVNLDGSEIKVEKSFKDKVYDVVVDDASFDAFQMASFSFYGVKDFTFKELKKDISKSFQTKAWYKDLGIIVSFFFNGIILISFSLLILSFTKRVRTIYKLALLNSALIVITLLYIIFLERSFEHIHQIKYGYYAFLLTNLLFFYYSKLALKTEHSRTKA